MELSEAILEVGRIDECDDDAGFRCLFEDGQGNPAGVTVDAPGYSITDLLRRVGMLTPPSDMALPEEGVEVES